MNSWPFFEEIGLYKGPGRIGGGGQILRRAALLRQVDVLLPCGEQPSGGRQWLEETGKRRRSGHQQVIDVRRKLGIVQNCDTHAENWEGLEMSRKLDKSANTEEEAINSY